MSFYPSIIGSAGTLSVANASTAVTGVGTFWASQVRAGDVLHNNGVQVGLVRTVNSNTSITLVFAYTGTAITASSNWVFHRQSTDWNGTGLTNDFLAKVLALLNWGASIAVNASGTLAGRAAFNTASPPFVYAQTDVNPWVMHAKASATSGDWATPMPLSGFIGASGAPGGIGLPGGAGLAGSKWFFGSGAPSNAVGVDGDCAFDGLTGVMYQKVSGAWASTGYSVKGPPGDPGVPGLPGAPGSPGTPGTPGTNGKTIHYSASNPTSGLGQDGDFHINTVTMVWRGPKAGGAWPAGVSLLQLPPVVTINVTSGSTAVTLNMAVASYFIINLQASVSSVTITNWPAAGQFARCNVQVNNTGNYDFAHPSGVKWPNRFVPANTRGNGAVDVFLYTSGDGGVTKLAYVAGEDFGP